MVTVPRAQSNVSLRGIPTIQQPTNAPIEAFGGGQAVNQISQATQKGINAASQMIQEEKVRADDAATNEAFNKAVRKRNELMWDPKAGAMHKQGKDAFGVVDSYGEQYEKALNDIEDGLANDDQKAMFKKIRLSQATDLNNDLTKHTFQESRKYEEQTTEAGLATTRDDAVLNYQTPGRVEQSIVLQKAMIQEQAARNGLPAEWVALKTKDVESKTHSAVIDRMLANGQDVEAQAYYDKAKGNLTGADSVALEKNLEEGTRRGKSQRESDKIYRETNSLSAALEQAREIQDPHLRDDVTSRLKDQYALKKLADNDRLEKLHQSAGNIIDQTGSTDKIPPNVWNQFSVSEKQSLKAYAKAKREGTDIVTNWDDYYNLKTQAGTAALKNEFLKTNLMSYRTKLADSEFKELVSLQASMRKGDDNSNQLDGFMSDQQVINNALISAGINPNVSVEKDKAEAQRVANFRRQVQVKQVAFERQTGKKASAADVEKISNDLLVQGITKKGWIWDTRSFKFEAEGQPLEFSIDDVPKADRDQIEDALKRRGISVTDEKVVELYTRKVNQ